MRYHTLDDTETHALCNPTMRFAPPPGFVMGDYEEPDIKPGEMCPECARREQSEEKSA